MTKVIVTNLYPGHFHFEPLCMSLNPAGYKVVSISRRKGGQPNYDGPSVGQFVFNYPMSRDLVRHILRRCRTGEPAVVMMDDPLAFFDKNINRLIVPVLKAAARVYTSTDNMLPVYRSIGVNAQLLVGLGNPQYDVAKPAPEAEMEYDWGFIGTLMPQRFRFFWQLKQLLPDLRHYFVTEGFGPEAVKQRVRRTRCNIAYGNFSDITDFKSNSSTLRAWEFPYAGAFILHDYRPLILKYFKEGESIVMFRSVEECASLILRYKEQPEERARIVHKARKVVGRRSMLKFFPNLFMELSGAKE